jgi:hypothetical protein
MRAVLGIEPPPLGTASKLKITAPIRLTLPPEAMRFEMESGL